MEDGVGDELVALALYVSALSRGAFSLLLAVSATAAGALVSWKIRTIVVAEDVEPSLRRFGYEKMAKVALAAFVFSTCSLCRAYVLLRESLFPGSAPLSPMSLLGLGVVLPEMLPTLAALLVLRRRPIACACWQEEGGALCGLCTCCAAACTMCRGRLMAWLDPASHGGAAGGSSRRAAAPRVDRRALLRAEGG